MLEFNFLGSGFLKWQIRIMVGTLLDVGCGRMGVEAVEAILQAKRRADAGLTAVGDGLTLLRIFEVGEEQSYQNAFDFLKAGFRSDPV